MNSLIYYEPKEKKKEFSGFRDSSFYVKKGNEIQISINILICVCNGFRCVILIANGSCDYLIRF